MAKRANPFTEDFMPQTKIHVGLKQFNNNNDRLQKVYEKTLELLFKGAKKSHELDNLNNNELNFVKKDKMKQLFIGKDGSLLHSGCVIANKTENKKCSCGGGRECQCVYCEATLCAQCQLACSACAGAHCARCTLTDTEGAPVCVSCYQ